MLIALCVVLAPAVAHAQGPGTLMWTEDGEGFATFGPNASVTINTGYGVPGTCDGFFAATNIYVVSGPVAGGASLTDVSNEKGLANTVFLASGGIFISESIAFTKPSGKLGPGVYGVVYDECQNGVFDVGVDTLFYPAFNVVIPSNIANLPTNSFAATKAAAKAQSEHWQDLLDFADGVEELMEIKDTLECLSGGVVGCVANMAIDKLHQFIIDATMGFLGVIDPAGAAKDVVLDTMANFDGIAEDPPDPHFQQPEVLEAIVPIPATSTDPILNAFIGVGNAQATQTALLRAMLHAMERYQGADQADDSEWALVHARALQSLSTRLIDQIGASNAALTALDAALTADPRNFDTASAQSAPLLAQIVSGGFNTVQLQALMNAGATPQQIADLRTSIAAEPAAPFNEAAMRASIAALIAGNTDWVTALTSLITDMDGNIATLLSPPNLPSLHPVAKAGGPYMGVEGAPISFNAAASSDPDGTIVSYAWDMDRDGLFGEATGAAPSFTFPSAFTGFVGVLVTDNAGHIAVDYALVTVGDANTAPALTSTVPAAASLSVPVGTNQAFAVTASDPDGDALTARWSLDFVAVANGPLNHAIAFNTVGEHTVRAEVTDGLASGGSVIQQWTVTVLAGDADGDGWNSNTDCNDANPAIHPLGPEIIGNGIDDDCRAETLDGGTPPAAAFTVPAGVTVVGTPITFTGTSYDPDSPVLIHAWTFGDGGSSSDANPTHTYAAAGTFTVTLTVTDPQSFTSTVSHTVTATHLPVAAFTFAPNPGRRGEPIQFSDASTDADGAIASSSWNFGDGGMASGANAAHAFATAGTYPVSLTVTDGDGATASTTQMVTVGLGSTDPTMLRFAVMETNCGWGTQYTFALGGVTVATFTPGYDCTCYPNAARYVEVTDPAVLAQLAAPVCQTFSVSSNTTSYIGWARAEIVRASGVETVRIVNTNGDADPYSNSVCNGYGGARSFTSGQANFDGDAIGDCSDNDIDGDGVQNAADNCVFAPNTGQEDGDGNGIGNACQDTDRDMKLDAVDNCPVNANPDQRDFDGDGIGNPCDPDIDGDAFLNAADNCAYVSNADQADGNGDGFGDVCDIQAMRFVAERSNQNYATTLRLSINGSKVGTMAPVMDTNCSPAPTLVTITDPELLALLGTVPSCNAFGITADNYTLMSWAKAELVHRAGTVDTVVIHDKTGGTFQQYACYAWEYGVAYQNATPDTDHDSIFDCKDPDLDADGVLNTADNCPYVPNTSQADVDGNGIGDACQDTDADTVLDINDNCAVTPNTNQSNIDGDTMGDACDPDRDNDTVLNAADNCPNNPNTDQADLDADGVGDVCDPDLDADTVTNGSDNCLATPNTDQRNTDGDSAGDACDPDKDNDGVLNTADNCELRVNAGQQSTNPYGVGDACVPIPVTVPWLGVTTQPHQVYSGGKVMLQGVAIYDGDYAPAELTGATWDPGDGSAPVSVSVANPYALELEHTYTGAPGTPFFATLTINFADQRSRTDVFRVLIQPRTLDVEANMAIDRGLWALHKSQTRYSTAAYWWAPNDGNGVAATAATLNAFGINNHRINGDRLEDPYVEDVRRGFVHLESNLAQAAITAQPAGDPDTNGNGIALYSPANHIYQSGQVAEAFIAAGQQTSVAVAGAVAGRTFRDIVQDIMDGYWYGQVDIGSGARGGWHYGWNYGSADNSTAQWGAITGLAGENAWQIPVPQWVKTENRDYWMRASQKYDGSFFHGTFGYGDANCVWSNCMSTTPSGMVQLIFDGVRNDSDATSEFEMRYQAAKTFMAKGMRNAYHLSDPSFGGANYYSLFAMTKAFRLAVDDNGSGSLVPDPVTLIDDNPNDALPPFDWYRSDPAAGDPAPIGVARLLISRQSPGGNWPDVGYWGGSLATAYSVIILSPTIFELGPAAMCAAVPSVVGVGDLVTLDGSGSVHNDPFGSISSYTWDFQDGSPVTTIAAPTTSATHAFGALGTFNVLLTVADQNGITASASCPVQVIDGNLPPTAVAGGPYNFCAGAPMVLNASGSADPEGGPLSFAWDLGLPLNFTPVDATAATFDAAAAFASLVPGTYQIGLRVSDDHGHSTSVFPNITIHAASDPAFCNTPPELTVPPNLTTLATSAAGAEVNFSATAIDAGDGPLTPSCTPPSGTTFAIGSRTVSCTVTDSGGLTVSKSFTVTVINNPPAFVPHADITTPAMTSAGAVVSFTATGTDVEDVALTAVCVPASGAAFPLGPTTVNCTVTDSGGLSATGSFSVTVTNHAPTFTPPANITTTATSAAGAVVTFTATGSDLEQGPIAAACTPPSGSTFAIGTTTVNCSVTDNQGLAASGSFTVTVTSGNSAPVCSATPSTPLLSWPPNHKLVPISLLGITDPDGNPFTVKVTLIAQDEPTNTQGDGNTPSDATGIGTAIPQVRAERSGDKKVPGNGRVYHIFYTATDSLGASCTGKVLVGVPHDQGGSSVPIDDGPKFNSVTGAKLP